MQRRLPMIEAGSGFITVPESGRARVQGGWLTESGRAHVQGGWLTESGAPRVQGGWLTESGRAHVQGGWLTESGRARVQGGWLTESGRARVQGGWLTESGASTCAELVEMSPDEMTDAQFEAFLACGDAGELELESNGDAEDPCGVLIDLPEAYKQCREGYGGLLIDQEDAAGGVEASTGMSDEDALAWGAQAGDYFDTASDLILGLFGKQGGATPAPSNVPAGGADAARPSTMRRILPVAAGVAAVGAVVYFVSRRT
jgi:hypothetical protein